MDLFRVVNLAKSRQATIGVRPLREGEVPILDATAGRTMEEAGSSAPTVLEATPLQSVPSPRVPTPLVEPSHIDVAESMEEEEEVSDGLKRKRELGGDDASSSRKKRHVVLDVESSSSDVASSRSKETAPPNIQVIGLSSEQSGDSLPKASPAHADLRNSEDKGTEPLASGGVPVDPLMEELASAAAHQATLVAQLKTRYAGESSHSAQKDEEIAQLKALLANSQAEAESACSYSQKLVGEKMLLLSQINQERVKSADYKAACTWALKYLEKGKEELFSQLGEFGATVGSSLEEQEMKLRQLSIEYDEELYPQLVSSIAERRWLISHGLRLAALSTLESREVVDKFGAVVQCAFARGKDEAVEEL